MTGVTEFPNIAEHVAVIGGINDNRVIAQTQLIKLVENLAESGINSGAHRIVARDIIERNGTSWIIVGREIFRIVE